MMVFTNMYNEYIFTICQTTTKYNTCGMKGGEGEMRNTYMDIIVEYILYSNIQIFPLITQFYYTDKLWGTALYQVN